MLSSRNSSTPPVTWRLPKSRSARKFSQCPSGTTRPRGNHFRPTTPKHKSTGFERPLALVGLSQRSLLETPQRRRIVDQEPHGSPGCLRERGRRQSLCRVGRQTAPYRSGMGNGRPRRSGGQNVHLGRRIKTKRQMDGELFQGRFPARNTAQDGYLYTAPVGSFPPNEYGLHDMAGKRLGDLQRLLSPGLLQTVSPRSSLESKGARIADHADRTGAISRNRHLSATTSGGQRTHVPSRDQRRLVSLSFRLLSALPPGGPPPFGIARPEQPHGVSLRQGCRPRGLKALSHSFKIAPSCKRFFRLGRGMKQKGQPQQASFPTTPHW